MKLPSPPLPSCPRAALSRLRGPLPSGDLALGTQLVDEPPPRRVGQGRGRVVQVLAVRGGAPVLLAPRAARRAALVLQQSWPLRSRYLARAGQRCVVSLGPHGGL